MVGSDRGRTGAVTIGGRIPGAVLAVLAGLAVVATSCATPLLSATITDGGGSSDGGTPHRSVQCATPGGSERFDTAAPSDVDMDPAALRRAVSYATARGAQSVRIYRHGCLVARSGNDPLTEDMRLQGWSMTKGVVSTVVGRAVTLGLMDIDAPISRYLSGTDEFELDAQHASLTVREFLNQTTGLRMAWINDLWSAGMSDSAADELARPFQAEPDSTFLYAQTAVTALVAVTEAAVGEDFQSFARRELFEPIGIRGSQWRWDRDASGRKQGFAFLEMAPLAWARLGHLLLREGLWGSQRLIDPGYIAQGRRGTAANPGYGFLWWTNEGDWHITSGFPAHERKDEPNWPGLPRDAFGYSGLFDQTVLVIPSLDMVILRMGFPSEIFGDPIGESPGIRPKFAWRYHRLLMRAVTDVEVADPGPWRYERDDTEVDVHNIIEPTLPPFEWELPGSLGELFLAAMNSPG